MVKKMFEAAKVDGTYTNHSLRATGASSLFNAGVPEAVSTGHKSTEAVSQTVRACEFRTFLHLEVKNLLMKNTAARSKTKPIQQGDDTSYGQKPKSQN